VYGDVFMSAVSEGGWNILRTETRTSPISHTVVDWKLLQLSSTSNYSPDHPTVRIWPSSYHHLFGPLKGHLRGHHFETDEAVQKAVQGWLRGAGTDFYRRGILKFFNAGRNA
jgi:hypothetical protein